MTFKLKVGGVNKKVGGHDLQVGLNPIAASFYVTKYQMSVAGWEARIDGHGRIFYIDHINHLTTWKRPQAPMTVRRQPTISAEDRRNMDRR